MSTFTFSVLLQFPYTISREIVFQIRTAACKQTYKAPGTLKDLKSHEWWFSLDAWLSLTHSPVYCSTAHTGKRSVDVCAINTVFYILTSWRAFCDEFWIYYLPSLDIAVNLRMCMFKPEIKKTSALLIFLWVCLCGSWLLPSLRILAGLKDYKLITGTLLLLGSSFHAAFLLYSIQRMLYGGILAYPYALSFSLYWKELQVGWMDCAWASNG